jgi:hypothetical protein
MPRKKSDQKVTWKGYVNITIPAKMNDKVLSYVKDDKNVWQQLTQIIDEGYTVKFVKGKEDGEVRCNLYCQNPDDDNAGYSLGAWATDWYTALAVCLFKHFVIAQGLWEGYEKPDTGSFG